MNTPRTLLLPFITGFTSLLLTGCDKQSGETVEGRVQVLMSMPSSFDPNESMTMQSRVQLITRDKVYLLIVDEKTEFVDEESPSGMLALDHLYRVRVAPFEFPEGVETISIPSETDEIVYAVSMEKGEIAGPDAPSMKTVEAARVRNLQGDIEPVLEQLTAIWGQSLTGGSARYSSPKIRYSQDAEPLQCGSTQNAVGTYYCPETEVFHVNLKALYKLGKSRGKFASAAQNYVLAHVSSHRFQSQNGQEVTPIKSELLADCHAGVLLRKMQDLPAMERGDTMDVINAAGRIGFGQLQSASSNGHVVPDPLTHAQFDDRVDAVLKGLKLERITDCD